MNREIKFRAWDNIQKKWYQFPSWDKCGADATSGEEHLELISNQYFKWCQFTGVKDKNGVEIYEGDIVQCYEKLSFMVVKWNIEWACFELDLIKGNILYEISDTDLFEVIGNIYENSELLGGKEE